MDLFIVSFKKVNIPVTKNLLDGLGIIEKMKGIHLRTERAINTSIEKKHPRLTRDKHMFFYVFFLATVKLCQNKESVWLWRIYIRMSTFNPKPREKKVTRFLHAKNPCTY